MANIFDRNRTRNFSPLQPCSILAAPHELHPSRLVGHCRLPAITLILGLYFRRRSGKSVDDYFVSGRNVNWWLAGTSMVATTFAADTPLVVTGLVYTQGIAGNWLWWGFLLSGMMTVFLFARLWRRSGLLTDVQFAEMRYSGKPAAFLRGFRAIYLGLLMNCLILGWVTKAMTSIVAHAGHALVLQHQRYDAIGRHAAALASASSS